MILLTNLYDSRNEERNQELTTCLRKNEESGCFSEIYRFMEFEGARGWADDIPWLCHKTVYIPTKKRMTFKAYFEFANSMLPAGSHVCIANADIWFDQTLSLIQDRHLDNAFLCLSRWDEQSGGKPPIFDRDAVVAQDAWIFRTPLPMPELDTEFTQGCVKCDNVLVHVMKSAGRRVYNPTQPGPRGVDIHHLHLVEWRTYGPCVPGPIPFLSPCELPA